MKKSFLNLEGVQVLSRTEKKNFSSGLGPEPEDFCSGSYSWSAVLSESCLCQITGGTWTCGQCLTSAEARIKRLVSNNCDQFNAWE